MKKSSLIAVACIGVVVCWGVLAGCTKQSLGTGGADCAGEYTLVSVDGKDLPATVNHGGAAVQVVSGSMLIKSRGSCTCRMVFIPPEGEEFTRKVDATYTLEGSELTMSWHGAGMTLGRVENDVLTMNNEGMVFVYAK